MKEIKLTQGKVALVDDEDFEYLNQFKWCAVFDRNTFYAVRSLSRKTSKDRKIKMHWDILGVKGVDHINHNGLDCQRHNMRKCTHRQNMMNRTPTKNSSSEYKGVSWHKASKKFMSYITSDKKMYHLGLFVSEEMAAKVYDAKAKELFGEFAYLNFQ